MVTPQLTLDTNIPLEYWKNQAKKNVVEWLITLVARGVVDLAVTARIRDDVPRLPLCERLNDLPKLRIHETGTVIRVDHWVVGRDMVGDDWFSGFWPAACELVKSRGTRPPDWRDWDHLHAHYLLKRDAFLTWDGGILCLASELQQHFGICVQAPEEYLLRRNLTDAD